MHAACISHPFLLFSRINHLFLYVSSVRNLALPSCSSISLCAMNSTTTTKQFNFNCIPLARDLSDDLMMAAGKTTSSKEMLGLVETLRESRGYSVHKVNGLVMYDFVLQEEVDKLKNFQLYPDDVMVVSYHKSGTTWVQEIVRLLRNNGVKDDIHLNVVAPWLEADSTLYPEMDFEKLPRPRIFKSHFPYDVFPCGPPNTTPCKYICVMRNPKDVAVSFYFHNKRYTVLPDDDWETFWEKFIGDKLMFGNYFDHVLSWWPHRNDANVLILKYEDMKRNLPAAVSQIASFIGADVSSDVIAKVADMTTFDKMKVNDTANLSWLKDIKREGSTDFLRKGQVGDWKNYLTPEQSDQIDAICAERLKDTGLEFDYE